MDACGVMQVQSSSLRSVSRSSIDSIGSSGTGNSRSSLGRLGRVPYVKPSMDGETELSSDDDVESEDGDGAAAEVTQAASAAAAVTATAAISVASQGATSPSQTPSSPRAAARSSRSRSTIDGGRAAAGHPPHPAHRSISPFPGYDSGGASGSEVEDSNDDFGQYLSTLKVSLRADSAASEDWGNGGGDSGNVPTVAIGRGGDGDGDDDDGDSVNTAASPEKSAGEGSPRGNHDSPPSAHLLSPSGAGSGDGGGLVTPARRPDAGKHGLRTPFEKRIDWLNRLLAAEIEEGQLEYAKMVLQEKDLDISEDLPTEVADMLIDAIGAETFRITIDVLRQVVHLPRLLSRVDGIGRAVDQQGC